MWGWRSVMLSLIRLLVVVEHELILYPFSNHAGDRAREGETEKCGRKTQVSNKTYESPMSHFTSITLLMI